MLPKTHGKLMLPFWTHGIIMILTGGPTARFHVCPVLKNAFLRQGYGFRRGNELSKITDQEAYKLGFAILINEIRVPINHCMFPLFLQQNQQKSASRNARANR